MKYKKELILLFFVLFLCFMFFEITIRLMKWPVPMKNDYPVGMTSFDSTKGYILTPNFTGNFPNTNISISVNSKGLRDYEHEYIKKDNTLRILALGDSVTFGSGLRYEETYLAKLESLMNKSQKIEIIKTGVGGYEFDQQRAFYEEEGQKYKPDIVLIGLVLNDLNIPDVELIKKNYETYGNDMKKDSKARIFIKTVCHSCVFTYSVLLNYNKRYAEVIYGKWNDEPTVQEYASKLSEFNEELKENNISLIIVSFPYTWQFENFNGDFRKDYLPQQKMEELAIQEDIYFLDLSTYLDKKNYKDYYIPYDNVHLNEEGNEIVAQEIYDYLKEEKIA